MKDGVVLVDMPVFIKPRHELATLLKKIQVGSAQGVELLITTLQRPESEVTLKLKLQCAEALIDLEVKITDQISKDQLTRQIAEIKKNGLVTPLGQEGGPKRLPPRTDFTTIQEV